MSKTIKRLLIAGLMCASAGAAALQLKADAPERYVVKKGDTLWDISERYTGKAWEWPEIWHNNPQIDNPHLIYPDDVISLVMINGEQKLMVTERGNSSRTVRLSPNDVKLSPSARIEPIEAAIAAIPMDAIQGFLNQHRILSEEELEAAPHIIASADGRVMVGAGGKVYARNKGNSNSSAYSIYRAGQVFKDPVTKEVLGRESIEIGKGTVSDVNDDVITLEVVSTKQQVRNGDRLMETGEGDLRGRFIPKAPGQKIYGQIMSVDDGVSYIGQYDVVALNRGIRDGIEPGHVMLVKSAGAVVYDREAKEKVRLPSEEAGSMMVFRVFDKLSYALIMRAQRPLKVGDYFESPDI